MAKFAESLAFIFFYVRLKLGEAVRKAEMFMNRKMCYNIAVIHFKFVYHSRRPFFFLKLNGIFKMVSYLSLQLRNCQNYSIFSLLKESKVWLIVTYFKRMESLANSNIFSCGI